MRQLSCLLLALLVGALLAQPPGSGEGPDASQEEESRLRAAFLKTDGPALVGFLRTRARGEASPDELKGLLAGLDATEALARQKACAGLVAIGAPALPVLRLAARDADRPDAANLARRCLESIEKDSGALSMAAIRLLAARRPEGTARALLAYLPHAENDAVMQELREALGSFAHEKGKASPALLEALSDENPLRRASAIVALCSSGSPSSLGRDGDILRKLLTDRAPSVRLQASLALARVNDSKAVATLILLLAELPLTQAREVEGYLTEMAGDLAPKVSVGEEELSRQKARDTWAKWWVDTEGPGLLDELRKRTIAETDSNETRALIEKLGDDSFEVRQKAEDALKKLGSRITPLLRQAEKHADLEVRTRAAKCLAAIEMEKVVPLSPAVARLIAIRKPRGASKVILDYIPFADDETLVLELQTALEAVSLEEGKPAPALLEALNDRLASRRAAAGAALSTIAPTDHLPRLLKLLEDPDPQVRLRVALALAWSGEASAVPALIRLVVDLPSESGIQAEDYLRKLAGESTPKDLPEGDEGREKRSKAWSQWWNDHKASVKMLTRGVAPAREPYRGYTLLVMYNGNQLVEWDRDRRVRWTMSGLQGPFDAKWLPGGRLLISEYNALRITERNIRGDILWQVSVPSNPMSAQRLPNGNTFVVCRNLVAEYDRGGKQVYRIDRGDGVICARKLDNGQIALFTQNQLFLRLNRAGKELKNIRIPVLPNNLMEIQSSGNLLVPFGWNGNKISEFTPEGKEIWTATTVPNPQHAIRLPGGNTLVTSQSHPIKIYEIDRKGKIVSDQLTDGLQPLRVRRR